MLPIMMMPIQLAPEIKTIVSQIAVICWANVVILLAVLLAQIKHDVAQQPCICRQCVGPTLVRQN